MNVSSANVTVVIAYRDAFAKAVVKNVFVVVLGISINYINIGLIQTFCSHQMFYLNPRYILFFNLVVNDMVQMSLTVILFVTSYVIHRLRVSLCSVLVILALFTTENTPLILASMAMECSIAVCMPLRHSQICTVKRTWALMGLIWTICMISVLPDLFVTLATQPLEFFHGRVFCQRQRVFPGQLLTEKKTYSYIVYLATVWLIMFYAYFKILFTVKTASKDARKGRNTILLHGFQMLLCLSRYIGPPLKEALRIRFPKNYTDTLFAMYIIVQMLPRSISPIIYGLRDKAVRSHLKKKLGC